jgi:hypothetical protein
MAIHFWAIHSASAAPKPAEAPSAAVEAYASATLCWLLSAGVYIGAKWVAPEMPPWALAFWRVVSTGKPFRDFPPQNAQPLHSSPASGSTSGATATSGVRNLPLDQERVGEALAAPG